MSEGLSVLIVLVLLLIGGGIYWPLIMSSQFAQRHVPELERKGMGFRLVAVGVLLNFAVVTLGILITGTLIWIALSQADYP